MYFILFVINMTSATLESTININECDDYSDTNRLHIKGYIIEPHCDQLSTIASSSKQYSHSKIHPIKYNTDLIDLSLNKTPSSTVSSQNIFSMATNTQLACTQVSGNENTNSQLTSHKRKCATKKRSSKKRSVSRNPQKNLYSKLIRKKVESMVTSNPKLEYYRYFDFPNSYFLLDHFENLLNSCFSSCHWIEMVQLRDLVVDIFIYYRFKAIKNALIGKQRASIFLEEVCKSTGFKKHSENMTKCIFRESKKLNEISPKYFLIYPNLVSHKKIQCNDIFNYHGRENYNLFRNEMIESLLSLKTNVFLKLNDLIEEYLSHPASNLNDEEATTIRILIYSPIYFLPFDSIIDTHVRVINLEEDDPFEKAYNNLFIDQYGNPFPFEGSAQAVKIQKFIIFIKACIFEQEDQLTFLEYVALLNFMLKEYREYVRSGDKNTISENFYDSLCFFVQSFAYSHIKNGEEINYSFENNFEKFLKGLRLLKKLFPNWDELISEENFSFLPSYSDNNISD